LSFWLSREANTRCEYANNEVYFWLCKRLCRLVKVSMKIEIARTSDTVELARCAKLMASSDPWLTLKRTYSDCLKSLEGNFREVYITRQNTELLGVMVLQMQGSFSGYLQSICVSANMRGLGLGKKMIQFAEERVFKCSPNFFLCVSEFNTEAIRLYEELGYVRIGEINDFVEKGFHEILMRKTIGSWNEFKK